MADQNNKQTHNNHEDLGLDRSAQKGRQRTINPDGSFNLIRTGGNPIGIRNIYYWVISTSWTQYWLSILAYYIIMNVIFACGYFLIGVDQLNGIPETTAAKQWLYCFFFSSQSFTTVGYGGIHPTGIGASVLAVVEAFTGLMTFALATGTLYGRFSKPLSHLKYSDHMIIAPFRQMTGLQFMVANQLKSNLMDVEARVNISWLDKDAYGQPIRKFQQAELEIDKIMMFPTNWVINHPIDSSSILYGKSEEELRQMDLEVFALLKGFDDAFSQTIYSRHSFMSDQLIVGAKFRRPFYYNAQGKMVIDLNKVGEMDRVDLPDGVK
jgi:inward rectifier potassium channel